MSETAQYRIESGVPRHRGIPISAVVWLTYAAAVAVLVAAVAS